MSSKQKPGPFYYTVDVEGTKYREEGKRITDIVVEHEGRLLFETGSSGTTFRVVLPIG